MTVLLAWREISAVSRGIADYMDSIDSLPTRIYGPADRHGVIEWQYILQSVRGLQQLTTFAGWRSDEGDRYLEGWATLTSERGRAVFRCDERASGSFTPRCLKCRVSRPS
jgi:hypothetical protein